MSIFRRLWRTIVEIFALARMAAGGPGWQYGLLFCVLVLAANLANVYIATLFIDWSKHFFDALEKVDLNGTLHQTSVYFALTAVSAIFYLGGQYVRKMLFIRWRSRLNSVMTDAWFDNKAYWRLQSGSPEEGIDNPDQRISEDCRQFVDQLLSQTIGLFTRIVGLFTYLTILWSLAPFALEFSLFGLDINIPHYMVWAAFIYVFVSSFLTHWLGSPLKDLKFRQQKREADYRFSLTRIRDWADAIAISNGEAAERSILDRRFRAIIDNWRKLINREFILGCFKQPYFQTVFKIPMFFALPAYLAGKLTLGGLMQVASAFSRVVNTLSWFIFYYDKLASWVATTNRLTQMLEATRKASSCQSGISFERNDQDILEASDLKLLTPDGQHLDLPSHFSIKRGERIWLNGPSGTGKTTLLKALAGLWMTGEGRIVSPKDWSPFFASQNTYMPLSGLAGAASYPCDPCDLDKSEISDKMQIAGLDHRLDDLDQHSCKPANGLSGGEKQRLVFMRILIARPDWIFLDEATSALDEKAEGELLQLLLNNLPDSTIVIISHRPPVVGGPWRQLVVGNDPEIITKNK